MFASVAIASASGCTPRAVSPPAASVATAPASSQHAVAPALPTIRDIVAKSATSVVVVRTPIGLGTGFVVERGIVATNLHVVAGADRIAVFVANGKVMLASAVVGFDATHDLALLGVPPETLPPALPLRESGPLAAGDAVVAIGTPQGLALTASTGIVSAVRQVAPTVTLVQTTAPISPGSSGGPLLDDEGRVAGITTLIAKSGQNLNFAVPVSYLSTLLALPRRPLALSDFAKLHWTGPPHKNVGERAGSGSSGPERPSFPSAVAGFAIGGTVSETQKSCTSHWQSRPNLGDCSKIPVDVPFATGAVRLYFSKERLVAVMLRATSLDDVRVVLGGKYGRPDYASVGSGPTSLKWQLKGGTISVHGEGHLEVLYTSEPPPSEANY